MAEKKDPQQQQRQDAAAQQQRKDQRDATQHESAPLPGAIPDAGAHRAGRRGPE